MPTAHWPAQKSNSSKKSHAKSASKNALQLVADDYDYAPHRPAPSLTLLTLNGLVAANGVIVPMLCEYYALEGISDLVATVRKIRQAINPDLDVTGIVRTMYDSRSRLVVEVSEQLKQHFGNLLFDTVIPRNIRLAEAPSHGLPALAYDAHAKGTQAYLDLADELIARLENKQKYEYKKPSESWEILSDGLWFSWKEYFLRPRACVPHTPYT